MRYGIGQQKKDEERGKRRKRYEVGRDQELFLNQGKAINSSTNRRKEGAKERSAV